MISENIKTLSVLAFCEGSPSAICSGFCTNFMMNEVFPRAFTHSTVISLGLSEYFKQMKTKKASHIIQCLIAFPHVGGEKHNSPLSSSEWLPD